MEQQTTTTTATDNPASPPQSQSQLPSANSEGNENIKIIRSIASYLSLSEVESLGSLYSVTSPHTYHSGSGGSSSDHYTNPHFHHQYQHDIREEEYCENETTPINNVNLSDKREDGSDDDDDEEYEIHSGPDAAAGFGLNVHRQQNYEKNLFSKTSGKENNIERGNTREKEETPGLIALSPMPLDDESYHDDSFNKQHKRSNKEQHCYYLRQQEYHQKNKNVLSTKYYHQLKEIQQNLQEEILSHPQSIRSYCVSSQREARKIIKRKKKKKHQYREDDYKNGDFKDDHDQNSLSGVLCPDCDNVMTTIQIIDANSIQQQNGQRSGWENMYTCPCQSNQEHTLISKSIKNRIIYPRDDQQQHQFCQKPLHSKILHILISPIFENVPLSIIFDITIQTAQTSHQTLSAALSLSARSMKSILQLLFQTVHHIWSIVSHTLNPFTIIDFIISLQQKVMGISSYSDAIATGIQSVTTLGSSEQKYGMIGSGFGVVGGGGILTRDGGLTSAMSASVRSGSVIGGRSAKGLGDWWRGGSASGGGRGNLVSEKMFRKLRKVDSAAKVINYIEGDDEVLTHHAKKRVQKMMHYRVPLRPFVATIEVSPTIDGKRKMKGTLFENVDYSLGRDPSSKNLSSSNLGEVPFHYDESSAVSESASMYSNDDDSDSPFMCTPKSFPPTPSSRAHVMARGTKFAQDVVFLARDQLRVQEGLDSNNAQTRAMAKALNEGKRLAVFNAADVGGGINLSCGQHCASKVGNDLYCSARGMIPVLRNSFVYFEMTVSTPPLLSMMLHHASLSIGLSTLEMPLNALAGAWKGSVGLCSTGQILAGSHWRSPLEPKTYGSGSTVGCLVYLDDTSAFETWDGVMVTASIVFNVDSHVIIPASQATNQTIPLSGQDHHASSTQMSQNDYQEHSHVLPLFVPREEELFPTLTLHSTQTEVLCRFCASDIIASSRESIGAPDGVVVYAVDGSVLFDCDNSYNHEILSTSDVDLSSASLQSVSSDIATVESRLEDNAEPLSVE